MVGMGVSTQSVVVALGTEVVTGRALLLRVMLDAHGVEEVLADEAVAGRALDEDDRRF